MPLVLTIAEGETLRVGEHDLEVTRIEGPTRFWVALDDSDEEVLIDDTKAEEVMPNVFVSAGKPGHRGVVKIAIDAPREIRIRRGKR